jgi:hypothetical protein
MRLSDYLVGRQHLRFWLEWVRGTMHIRDLSINCTSSTLLQKFQLESLYDSFAGVKSRSYLGGEDVDTLCRFHPPDAHGQHLCMNNTVASYPVTRHLLLQATASGAVWVGV